ncbi:MAG: hypothetical protein IMZ64_13540, partial [Bacteroidetes bacterium]|nr:hypothetical protein [Bacteroidota bacterium]
IQTDFREEETNLRQRFPHQVEKKRGSKVIIALQNEPLEKGRLFAVLPSETETPLPFHINADFYPSNDRKHIFLENDYQYDYKSSWNIAAIKAAARILPSHLDGLPDFMGYKGFTKFLEQIWGSEKKATSGDYHKIYAQFWTLSSPVLPDKEIVYTNNREWVKPVEARLLSTKVEQAASAHFEALGVKVVHASLREQFALFLKLGTPLIAIQDLQNGLRRLNLSQFTSLSSAPKFLQEKKQRHVFWRALDAILIERTQSSIDQKNAKNILSQYAVALSENNYLIPLKDLFDSDDYTRVLFPDVNWLKKDGTIPSRTVNFIIRPFKVTNAVDFLSVLAQEKLENLWQKNPEKLLGIYDWLDMNQADFLSDQTLIERIRTLPIWPSGKSLRPLKDLCLPGDFTDFLGLTNLVDVNQIGEHKDLLLKLKISMLDFRTYILDQIPKALKENNIGNDVRRDLVALLARKLNEYRGDELVKSILKDLPLVECEDQEFRKATAQVYFRSDEIALLESHYYVVHLAENDNKDAVFDFYKWLGVIGEPRVYDLIETIGNLRKKGPTIEARKAIQAIFEYLALTWKNWDDPKRTQYSTLKLLDWLPGTKQKGVWNKPDEVYAAFGKFLFESQASFLDIDIWVQRAGTEFMDFLGIPQSPTIEMVVNHLLELSRTNTQIELRQIKEIYRTLNDDKKEDPAIEKLVNSTCLYTENGEYLRPDQVFLGLHPFSNFRTTLPSNYRQYDNLISRLKIKETPDFYDHVQILNEISKVYQKHKLPLDQITLEIVINCWRVISKGLDDGEIDIETLSNIKNKPVIPNEENHLLKPSEILVEDRAGLKEKFLPELASRAIHRVEGTWSAWQAVGVKPLSQCISYDIISPSTFCVAQNVIDRIASRLNLFERVIESQRVKSKDQLNEWDLDGFKFVYGPELVVRPVLYYDNKLIPAEQENSNCIFIRDDQTFIMAGQDHDISWPAVAREIAFAIKPIGEVGSLAGGFKDILINDSFEQAENMLNELGYPHVTEFTTQDDQLKGRNIKEWEETVESEDSIFPNIEEPTPGDQPSKPPEEEPTPGGQPPKPPEEPVPYEPPKKPTPKKPKYRFRGKSYLETEKTDIDRSNEGMTTEERFEIELAGINIAKEYEID